LVFLLKVVISDWSACAGCLSAASVRLGDRVCCPGPDWSPIPPAPGCASSSQRSGQPPTGTGALTRHLPNVRVACWNKPNYERSAQVREAIVADFRLACQDWWCNGS